MLHIALEETQCKVRGASRTSIQTDLASQWKGARRREWQQKRDVSSSPEA